MVELKKQFWKQLKSDTLQLSMKNPLKYRRQENLMTYLFDYATPCITKTQKKMDKRLDLPFP